MNTLSHDAAKVDSVVVDVVEAIKGSSREDEEIRAQLGGSAGSGGEGRGTRYLVDLIASSVIVRVQAEGFNGCVLYVPYYFITDVTGSMKQYFVNLFFYNISFFS